MSKYVKKGNKIFKVNNNKDNKQLIAEYNKKDNEIKLYDDSSSYSKNKISKLFRFFGDRDDEKHRSSLHKVVDSFTSMYIITAKKSIEELKDNKGDIDTINMFENVYNNKMKIIKEKIKSAIENKADVNSTNSSGMTPLHRIVVLSKDLRRDYKNRITEIVDENESNITNIAKILIENNANINTQNDVGISPLHDSIYNYNMLKLLIENKADIEIKENKHGIKPLDLIPLRLKEFPETLDRKRLDDYENMIHAHDLLLDNKATL